MFIADYLRKRNFKKMISKIKKGKNVYIHPSVEIFAPEKFEIKDDVHIQQDCKFYADGGGIVIGQGTIFAHEVEILARNHVYDSPDLRMIPYDERFTDLPVEIGEYCWIGARVTILPGVWR